MTIPEGYVVGRINHVRERYPMQRLLHEAKKSKDWDLMTEAALTKLNNPDKRLLIPVLKPYEHSTEEFTSWLKGEYEGLGYGGNSNATSTTSSTPGKMFWVEMVDDGGKCDHPEAVKFSMSLSQL